jgi:hypothetical protein
LSILLYGDRPSADYINTQEFHGLLRERLGNRYAPGVQALADIAA